jgi:TRAP transporter 4TM/12TM fusion protein
MLKENSIVKPIIGCIAVALSLFHLYAGAFGVFETMMQRSVHVLTLLALAFLVMPASKKLSPKIVYPVDIALAGLALVIDVYMLLEHRRIITREWYYGPMTRLDIIFGTITIFLVLEAARRVAGWALTSIGGIFIIFALFGNYFPEPFTVRATAPLTLVDHMFLTPQGIFGIPAGVSATFIFLFIVFGAFLEQTGGGRFFINTALSLVGRLIGGPAKVSVVSSAMFGTISGSAAANVYGTGTFTIPLMKRFGYRPNFAGAVEASASTGGQITPPVLGAAAFVMAEYLGISYVRVCLASVIPALLYYVSVYTGVHVEAVKKGLTGMPKEEIPILRQVLARGIHFLFPLGVLIYLLIAAYTPFRAVFLATLALIAVAMMRKESRMNLVTVWKSLESGAINAIMVGIACASAGIVVGVLDVTGLGIRFVSILLLLSGGYFTTTLVLVMGACIVLGMGMPTTAAYILAALIGAPAIINFGIPPLAAHMFVFGACILSSITPPVALAAYAGAQISGGNPMTVGWIACRLGFPKFIVPFLYVYNPVLLWIGPLHWILWSTLTAILGVLAFSYGIDRWLWKEISWPKQILFMIAGLFLMVPEVYTDILGIAIFSILLATQWRQREKIRRFP